MIYKPRLKFDDYDAFVEKFKPKKTTDDCYTPLQFEPPRRAALHISREYD